MSAKTPRIIGSIVFLLVAMFAGGLFYLASRFGQPAIEFTVLVAALIALCLVLAVACLGPWWRAKSPGSGDGP